MTNDQDCKPRRTVLFYKTEGLQKASPQKVFEEIESMIAWKKGKRT